MLCLLTLAWIAPAHASLLEGDALDTAANIIAWVAIIIVPVVLIGVFWWLHIMPEKIAEKRRHPQLPAIKVICLLSLFFGGMLWPIAWVWAYTKPVLHKMAYGTDIGEAHGHGGDAVSLEPTPDEIMHSGPAQPAAPVQAQAPAPAPREDVAEMRRRIASLEMQLAAASAQASGRGPGGTT
nr:DUF3302 domain-containing protein [Lysobacter lactosilyticus]